jgi:hypothetical protein
MKHEKPNLTRMYHQLLDTYWMEHECQKRELGHSPFRCADVIHTREAARCQICMGYILLKESMLCALGEERDDNRRSTDTQTSRLQ